MLRAQLSTRALGTLASLAALALPALPVFAQGGVTLDLRKASTQTTSWNFPNGALPTAVGAVKNYTAKAKGVATADSTGSGHAAVPPASGNKLTYTSGGIAGGLPTGTFTPGTVTDTDTHVGPLGSISFGYVSITGSHNTGPNGAKANTADATVSASLMAMPGGNALFHGVAEDPYDFATMNGGLFPSGSYLGFSISMDSIANSLPATMPHGFWSSTTSGKIKNIITSDVGTFYAANPDTFYSLGISVQGSNVSVTFTGASVPGFSIIFDQTPAQIEAGVASAISGGWSGSLAALSGRIDLSGTTGAAIGLREELDVGIAAIPAPGAAAIAGLGFGLIAMRRRRD